MSPVVRLVLVLALVVLWCIVGICVGIAIERSRSIDYKARWQEANRLLAGEAEHWRIIREPIRGEYERGPHQGQQVDTYKLVVTNGKESYPVPFSGPGTVFDPAFDDLEAAAAHYQEQARKMLEAVSRTEASP
jgi:hypothetical protein